MSRLFRSVPSRLAVIAFSLFFLISLLSRLLLLIETRHDVTWDLSIAGAFATGVWFDLASALFAIIPWWLLGVLAPVRWLHSRAGKLLLAGLTAAFTVVMIFITTSEWFFWDEFSARFNFIAVDYLIWTQEVLDNITQSYPMGRIMSAIMIFAAVIVWMMHRKGAFTWVTNGTNSWRDRCVWMVVGLALPSLAVLCVNQSSIPSFTNQYHGELAKNGCWSFMAALKQMELDYQRWYLKLPKDQALGEAKLLLSTASEPATSTNIEDLRRSIKGRGPERRWNVILVCMESMSGDYLSYLGNKSGITPNLDRLAKESVFFESLYATGTRTVRGMEALTLNLPPTPGQAIIYRPEGTNLTTTFSPFLDRGYDCAFFYGGDGRFDYMNRYYSTNGCRIMDVGAWKKEDITLMTAWGACDEDMFHKTLSEADASHAAGKPFHYFCMTTSNHRPYDFPEGRIDLTPHSSRKSNRIKAAVKYSDWAIGDLIEKASKKPWFKDTLFVIVSDHCASSAGKTELNIPKYHIPAMIYNPSLVQTQNVSTLCSQIDLMPTVFGLLNWNYETLSYGHDLLSPSAETRPGRAFVSNYQNISLLRDEGIAILKPNRKFSSYACDRKTGDFTAIEPVESEKIVHDATIFYQSASWLFSSGRLKNSFRRSLPKTPPGPDPTDAPKP
jgi:phosphoglycerol transferase MdoB-like AlkP superfamily enzyme